MALDRVRNATDPRTGEHYVPQLYLYDPLAFDGDGAVAVSVGDLDTAENVSVTVPGFGTDAADIDGNTQKAINVQQAASEAGGTSTASLIWIGYDAPDNLTGDAAAVTNEYLAKKGGERLADTLDGLNAMRSDDFHLTAIGHSYGSTTTAHALTDHDVDVDDAVLLGSPGAGGGVEHADELGVNNDVWVGANSRDPVAALADNGWVGGWLAAGGGLGNDPAEDDFGANRFQAEDVDRGDYVRTFPQHTSYFDHDTESLYNIARVVNGDYDDVERADHTYDPWNKGPQDPEADRTPTSPDTDGDGDVDTKDD
nr:alpha/beta hydrolase [Nocardioides sp. KC13]